MNLGDIAKYALDNFPGDIGISYAPSYQNGVSDTLSIYRDPKGMRCQTPHLDFKTLRFDDSPDSVIDILFFSNGFHDSVTCLDWCQTAEELDTLIREKLLETTQSETK